MRRSRSPLTRTARLAGAGLVSLLLLALVPPAHAVTGNIDYAEPRDDVLQVLFSLDELPEGVTPDLDSVEVTFDGVTAEAVAEIPEESGEVVRRTAVLAMDVSNSMAGKKFAEAKAAARAFLDAVPDDVYVGVVTFAGTVDEAVAPTQDRAAVARTIDDLGLSQETLLYSGVIQAAKTAGTEGSRSVLVLSDGADTEGRPLDDVTKAIEAAEVQVDVVALALNPANKATLGVLADAGNGSVLSADDPAALSAVFTAQADQLARQVLVTVTPPADAAGAEGNLSVTITADGESVSDQAFVSMPQGAPAPSTEGATKTEVVEPGIQIPRELMYAGLAAAAVAIAFMLVLALGGTGNPRQDAVDKSIEAYTRRGAKLLAEANRQPENQSVTQQAVAVAESVLEGQQGIEASLGLRLESAGLAVKPAEWLLIHIGVALGFGLTGLLLGGGSVIYMALGLFLGLVGPWFYLTRAKSRRIKAFKAQLADTLQLMAGSLSAGLSLAQSVDTVVREGTDPMAAEFRRALVESRLGVEIEDAMMGVAERMQSVDFEWVVMAIRIQREVGGNLSELLNKVAETIREREYLERQVKTLSAEGRLSVWILGGLPPGFMGYLLLANPGYVMPMFTNPLGWAMLIIMTVLLIAGILWMKKVVKVEV